MVLPFANSPAVGKRLPKRVPFDVFSSN